MESRDLLLKIVNIEEKLDYLIHLVTGNGHHPEQVTELIQELISERK